MACNSTSEVNMTKRNKLYARLIVDEITRKHWDGSFQRFHQYLQFIRTQARKNNPYAMALRQIEG